MKHTFMPTAPVEWLDIPTVSRILSAPASEVLQLIHDGVLKARNVAGEIRVSDASVFKHMEERPVQVAAPESKTFVKVGNRAYEELPDGRLLPV